MSLYEKQEVYAQSCTIGLTEGSTNLVHEFMAEYSFSRALWIEMGFYGILALINY